MQAIAARDQMTHGESESGGRNEGGRHKQNKPNIHALSLDPEIHHAIDDEIRDDQRHPSVNQSRNKEPDCRSVRQSSPSKATERRHKG